LCFLKNIFKFHFLVTTAMCRTNAEATPINQILQCLSGETVKIVNVNYGPRFLEICPAVGKEDSIKNIQQYCSESLHTFDVISQL
jgi:hypothetical protein